MSSLNINKRGNNMKKTLIVLLTAVLAFSMLFVSCSNEAKLDEPVSVQFVTPDSRSLSSSVSADPETLVWHYSATKKSLTDFNYGATTDSIIGKDNAGNFYPIELSQGLWDFDLWAEAGNVEYYRGNTKGVLIEKRTDDTPVPISIVVSPFGGSGTIKIKDVLIAKKTTNGFANTNYAPNTVSIKKDGNVISQNPSVFNGTCTINNLDTGSYDIVLSYFEDNLTVAKAEITVVVYSGKTTTISGTIDEATSSGQFKVNVQKTGDSSTVTINSITDVSNRIELTDGTESSHASVSITVPENTVTTGSSLTLEKKITEQPSTVNVTAGNGATFYDVKLQQEKNGVTTDFVLPEGKYFTVELYVGKNLDIVSFKHHDEALEEKNSIGDVDAVNKYYYDSTSGYITFTTSSFSPFTAEYKFGGGLGTEDAPYLISNVDQFLALDNYSIDDINSDRFFKLTNDIDLSVLSPTKSYLLTAFGGTLDGDNHTIIGNNSAAYIFKYFVEDTTIKNVKMVADTTNLTIFFGHKLIKGAYEGSTIPYSKSRVNITYYNVDFINPNSSYYNIGDDNCSLYSFDNTSYCELYSNQTYNDGWMEDLRNNDSIVPYYFIIEDCDVYGNYYGGFGNSGAAIFNAGQIYGGHILITNSSFNGLLKGVNVSLVMANSANFKNPNTENNGLIVLENVINNGSIISYNNNRKSNLIFSNNTVSDGDSGLIVGNCLGNLVQYAESDTETVSFQKDAKLELSAFNNANTKYEMKLYLPTVYWFKNDNYIIQTNSNTFTFDFTAESEVYYSKVLSTSDLELGKFSDVQEKLADWDSITTKNSNGFKYQFVKVNNTAYLIIDYKSPTYKYYYSKGNKGEIKDIKYMSKALVLAYNGNSIEDISIIKLN